MATFAVRRETELPSELGGGRADVVAADAPDRIVEQLRRELADGERICTEQLVDGRHGAQHLASTEDVAPMPGGVG